MGFLQRSPFAILGALGLVSLASGVMQLEQNIADWVHVWQSVTRPIWNFLLGWAFAYFDLKVPWYVSDYLTMGFITFSAHSKANVFDAKTSLGVAQTRTTAIQDLFESMFILRSWFFFFAWPYVLLWLEPKGYLEAQISRDSHRIKTFNVFVESFVWVAIIISINYALIYGGAPVAR